MRKFLCGKIIKNLFAMNMIQHFSRKKSSIIAIIFCFSILLISCNKNSSSKDELSIKPKDGICLTQEFENNVWRFPIVGDMPDKTLVFKSAVPDKDAVYKVSLIIDYLADIESNDLTLSITTITPDGNSSWSNSTNIQFHTDANIKQISTENGRPINRITKEIYSQRSLNEEGEYSFEVYSSYSKMALYGIKSLSIKIEKQKNN